MLGYRAGSQDLIKREEIMFGEAWGSADGLWETVYAAVDVSTRALTFTLGRTGWHI